MDNNSFNSEVNFYEKDGNKNIYVLKNGKKISLDSDIEICSEIIDRKIKISKNGKYGSVVLYPDTNLEEEYKDYLIKNSSFSEELNNYIKISTENSLKNMSPSKEIKDAYIHFYNPIKIDDEMLEEIKEVGYNIVPPIFDKLYMGKGYLNAETEEDNKFYIFDGYGNLVHDERKNNFTRINDETILNNNDLYRSMFESFGSKTESYDSEIIYLTAPDTIRYNKHSLLMYTKDGRLLHNRNIDESNIISIEKNSKYLVNLYCSFDDHSETRLFNIKNNKYFDNKKYKYYRITSFIDGHAYVVNTCGSGGYLIDEDFNVIRYFDYNMGSDTSACSFYDNYGYFPIKEWIGKGNGKGKYIYGYLKSDGEEVMKFYNSREKSKKKLDKYIKKQEKIKQKLLKKQEKLLLKQGKTFVVEEPLKRKNSNNEIYELEDKIKSYLNRIKIPKLDVKLRLMQRDYQNRITESSKNDIENRKNVILNNSNSFLTDMDSSTLCYKNYKNELQSFLDTLERNKYVIEILDKINLFNEALDGDRLETTDPLLLNMKELYKLYSNLDSETRINKIMEFSDLLKKEKEHFEGYFFNNNEEKKYKSEESWEIDFRLKLHVLVEQFKQDYLLKNTNDKKNAIKAADNALVNDRYKTALIYCNQLKENINKVKSKTDDQQILELLKKYEDFEVDYNKTPEENIREIIKKTNEVMRISLDTDNIFSSQDLASYKIERNTK